eukprot:2533477-Lingulodinium_polyedra.AAC.1
MEYVAHEVSEAWANRDFATAWRSGMKLTRKRVGIKNRRIDLPANSKTLEQWVQQFCLEGEEGGA